MADFPKKCEKNSRPRRARAPRPPSIFLEVFQAVFLQKFLTPPPFLQIQALLRGEIPEFGRGGSRAIWPRGVDFWPAWQESEGGLGAHQISGVFSNQHTRNHTHNCHTHELPEPTANYT